MRPTLLFLALAAAGGILSVALWPQGLHGTVYLLWNILLCSFFILDVLVSPKPGRVIVQRIGGGALYHNTENKLSFELTNPCAYDLTIELADDAHMYFDAYDDNQMSMRVAAGDRGVFSYTVLPKKRGSFLLGGVRIRYTGVLGMCIKQKRLDLPAKLKVYPNIKDVSKYRRAMHKKTRLPQSERPIHISDGGRQFAGLRQYVDGDDYRSINWSASARASRLIVSEYAPQRGQPVYILVDVGKTMGFEVGGIKKLDYAISAALMLADVVNRQGDAAGLIVFDSRIRTHIPPGIGHGHRATLLESAYDIDGTWQTSDYFACFKALCEKQKRRAVVFIFTNFDTVGEASQLLQHVEWLKKQHTPVVFFMQHRRAVSEQYHGTTLGSAHGHSRELGFVRKALFGKGIVNAVASEEAFADVVINRYMRMVRV